MVSENRIYGASRVATFALGVQHLLVMFGATVLVPLLTGLDVGVALFASGMGTLVFHAVTGCRVPVYLGSSFAFIPAILAVKAAEGGSLPLACGGIVLAGLVYSAAALLVRAVSPSVIARLFPGHVTGSIIILIGLMLAPAAIENANGTHADVLRERLGASGCLGLAGVTLIVGVACKIYASSLRLGFLAMVPVLIAISAGYLLSLSLGAVDVAPVRTAAWIGVPAFQTPAFGLTALTIVVPVALVTIMEHLGDILAIGNVVRKDFVASPGLHRTLLGDGIATTIAGCLGGPANTTYSENTGTVALTGVHDPSVMRIAAILAVLLAFVPKVSAIIASIPTPVVGGISILLFGMIAAIGIRTFVDQRVDLSRPRTLIVTAAMLVLGAGDAQVTVGAVQLSGLGLAALVGIVLNLAIGGARRDG